jgi:hypothetical protein
LARITQEDRHETEDWIETLAALPSDAEVVFDDGENVGPLISGGASTRS